MSIRKAQTRTTVTPELESAIVATLMDGDSATMSMKKIGEKHGVTASTISRINSLYAEDGTKIAPPEMPADPSADNGVAAS